MYDPSQILAWLVANVQQMRYSRRTTLSMVVGAALQMKGVGVLALGRAMAGQVAAKHCIKRVWRFLRNEELEVEALNAVRFHSLRPPTGRTIILVDWTDIDPFQQLVFSMPRNGRALPFLSLTIKKGLPVGLAFKFLEQGIHFPRIELLAFRLYSSRKISANPHS